MIPDPHSIHSEPHLRPPPPLNPDQDIRHEPAVMPHIAPSAPLPEGHDIWDEPALLPSAVPDDPSATPAAILRRRWRQASPAAAWLLTLALVLAAGPFAILCAFLKSSSASAILAIVIVAPVVEEIAKAALPLTLIERAPYRFTSAAQITAACAAAGFIFAAIENIIYLNIYIRDPSLLVVIWRWTVCVLLHTGCALLSGRGLCRLWRTARDTLTRPDPAAAKPHIIAAAAIHGTYNAFALILSATTLFD